jgi:DNA-binding IclR family transcriptional regulator
MTHDRPTLNIQQLHRHTGLAPNTTRRRFAALEARGTLERQVQSLALLERFIQEQEAFEQFLQHREEFEQWRREQGAP